ncbi:serine hydrolase domain-containing protein [Paracoccus pantotrophus]|uniref:serine hydrolase domain-containing protein n=1 Tax=Paracoccus pantotrophus TaxID=82367 RepID=UPI00048C3054|nr:serine hydrolase domain-containing protein [Paracoccus pantotrophus]
MAHLQGQYDPRFEAVRELLAQNLETGKELGASLYVNIDGEEVLDLWGGWCEREHIRPWQADTIVNVFSGTKTVASLALLMMVDRGLLDVDAPVAHYWPEFAQNGKESVLVRHVMSHTAGLPAWEPPFSFEDAADIRGSTDRLAAQAGWWEPGTRASYHASSFGHLVSEIALRASGVPLRDFIRTEIAEPLEADFILGLGGDQFDRVATIYPADDPAPAPAPTVDADRQPTVEEQISLRTRLGSFSGTLGDPLTVFNSEAWRRTDFAGSSGHANARGLGRCLTALANDGWARGRRLLSPEAIALVFREQASGIDAYYARPIRWGIGYALAPQEKKERGPLPFLRPGPRTCYWYGTGGSMGIVDAERRITIAYAMNQCQSGRRSQNGAYYDAILDSL